MPRKRLRKSNAKPARRKPPRRASPRREAVATAVEAALAAFAHDIRTSLTGILALGELLASSNLGERERRWALSIKNSAEHLAALTTLAIDGARAEAAGLVLQQQVFRPRRLVEALAESLAARAETKGLRAEVAVADNLPETVTGDPVRLRAAMENLIDNAVKFTERGAVRLEASATGAGRGKVRLAFTVTDNGIGLKSAEIKRLFRPFAQASDDVARRYGGAGLGLAFVKRLAKTMGGDLTVTSRSGRGSSFRLMIPLARAASETAGESATPAGAAPLRRLSVLCAEDNPFGRVVLNTILTELGHRADFVASGEEAIAAVERGYDVVLMDVTLSGIDGIEATRRIRALAGVVGRTPIIGISGRSAPSDETAARSAGMNDYMRKPVSPHALSEAMAGIVNGRGGVA